MTLLPWRITTASSGAYEVEFRDGQLVKVVQCHVVEHDGIWGVQPDPDIFMTGEADARAVSAAVVALHKARAWGTRSNEAVPQTDEAYHPHRPELEQKLTATTSPPT